MQSQRRSKGRGRQLAIVWCSLINESLNACESWFWQHRCSQWSGRLLQQKGASPTFFAGCGSKKPWQSEEQQLESWNYPHFTEFHSDALTLTSCWRLQIIPGKGGKDETRKQEIWWFFMFWVFFPNVHEYFKWRKKYLCSPSTEIQYMLVLMQKISSFEIAVSYPCI